jgi:hypothetical protein
MGQDLTLPVDRIPVALILDDGDRHQVALFSAAGQDMSALLEATWGFLPAAEQGGRIRLFSRRAVACVKLAHGVGALRTLDDLPLCRRAALVRLRSGVTLRGELRYLAPPERRRTADYLNEPARTFLLHADDGVYHVVKDHVAYLEEQ